MEDVFRPGRCFQHQDDILSPDIESFTKNCFDQDVVAAPPSTCPRPQMILPSGRRANEAKKDQWKQLMASSACCDVTVDSPRFITMLTVGVGSAPFQTPLPLLLF